MLKDLIDQKLLELLPATDDPLFEMASYSMEGGKRLRPLLTLAVVEAFDGSIERALQPACAIEMVHAYSLIHDDLPCMDNDDFRRGKPTLHKAYPESHAVLTGDFLLTYAFETLSVAPNLSALEKNQMVSSLATRIGSRGMIGGQIRDIEKKDYDQTSLFSMHLQKTGALITAALEFGAILVGLELPPFQALGKNLGLAYQLTDDLLDQDGSVTLIGKKPVQEQINGCFEKALKIIRALPNEARLLENFAKEMIFRTV